MNIQQDLQDKKEVIIIDAFLTLNNNTVSNIVHHLKINHRIELTKTTVHNTLNKCFKSKKING